MNEDDVIWPIPRITIPYSERVVNSQWYMDGRLGEEFNRYQEPMQPKYNIKKHLL